MEVQFFKKLNELKSILDKYKLSQNCTSVKIQLMCSFYEILILPRQFLLNIKHKLPGLIVDTIWAFYDMHISLFFKHIGDEHFILLVNFLLQQKIIAMNENGKELEFSNQDLKDLLFIKAYNFKNRKYTNLFMKQNPGNLEQKYNIEFHDFTVLFMLFTMNCNERILLFNTNKTYPNSAIKEDILTDLEYIKNKIMNLCLAILIKIPFTSNNHNVIRSTIEIYSISLIENITLNTYVHKINKILDAYKAQAEIKNKRISRFFSSSKASENSVHPFKMVASICEAYKNIHAPIPEIVITSP